MKKPQKPCKITQNNRGECVKNIILQLTIRTMVENNILEGKNTLPHMLLCKKQGLS